MPILGTSYSSSNGYSSRTYAYRCHGSRYSSGTFSLGTPSLVLTNDSGSATISDQLTDGANTIRSPWSRSKEPYRRSFGSHKNSQAGNPPLGRGRTKLTAGTG